MDWFDKVCDLVIRPPRHEYKAEQALGSVKFTIDGRPFYRTDLEIKNDRGYMLKCSHYEPAPEIRATANLPCVVYSHGNAGSRFDGYLVRDWVLTYNISFFTFDFAGCGQSEGENISLGYYESYDIKCVVEYLRRYGNVSNIGLWGRSMGAASTVIYASRDPSISAIVTDSPFADLPDLMLDIAKSAVSKVPKAAYKMVIPIVRAGIRNRAGFSIDDCVPARNSPHCRMPALMCHGIQDSFIPIKHSERLQDTYGGKTDLVRFQGNHNSRRPPHVLECIGQFFFKCLVKLSPNDFYTLAKQHDFVLLAARVRAEKSTRVAEERKLDRERKKNHANRKRQMEANVLSNKEEDDLREEIERKLQMAEEEWATRETERKRKQKQEDEANAPASSGLSAEEEEQIRADIERKLALAEDEWLAKESEWLRRQEEEALDEFEAEPMMLQMDGGMSGDEEVSEEQAAEMMKQMKNRISVADAEWKQSHPDAVVTDMTEFI